MGIPTRNQVCRWDTSGLASVAAAATHHADTIVAIARGVHTIVHDDLIWSGQARQAAEDRADREQTQLGAIATAYDHLAEACAGADNAMGFVIGEIKTILKTYEIAPLSVDDAWIVHGVQDENAEGAIQLARLAGLAKTLGEDDVTWSGKINAANDELDRLASQTALAAAMRSLFQFQGQDPRVSADRMTVSAAAFQQIFGRPPTSPSDWSTAEALNPKSYTPEFQGVHPEIRVVRINPVPGQGVVRMSQYIEQRDVSDPDFPMRPGARDLGNNRTADPNFDPEHSKVTTYIDYENGIVVMRQNPSVRENDDGSPGHVTVGAPDGRVWQNPDGSVRIQYEATNPLAPGIATKPPFSDGHHVSVNGDLVISPGPNGVTVNGTRTDYPSMEVYQDGPDGRTRFSYVDPAKSGSSLGPAMNLPFHHDIGLGPTAFRPFHEWNNQYDVPGNPKPSTTFGPVTDPPRVPVPKQQGTI
ncbi:hypothetical protein [Nocardia pseudobrasiliensis]|uniref:Uncharacterized protein n=1 Tax=Nocardia pseudobrasiliensis TaxID=45979 RepID=A0A370HTQ7_9NOCA|nr:hypothetical protein [Nocardia pseudobrasiliensis]RDI61341.1 hypothetical protein DFR76_11466 [Nocardia pseudobrasiliensis]